MWFRQQKLVMLCPVMKSATLLWHLSLGFILLQVSSPATPKSALGWHAMLQ